MSSSSSAEGLRSKADGHSYRRCSKKSLGVSVLSMTKRKEGKVNGHRRN